jgi:hypothetical protein
MRFRGLLIAGAALSSPALADETTGDVAPVEQFANATATCFRALQMDTPAKVLEVAEADGWRIDQVTPIGGTFRKGGSSVHLRIETVLFSRICTVLGNRDIDLTLAETSDRMESSLRSILGNKVGRDEGTDYPVLVYDEKYRASITPQQNGKTFNTQITVMARGRSHQESPPAKAS